MPALGGCASGEHTRRIRGRGRPRRLQGRASHDQVLPRARDSASLLKVYTRCTLGVHSVNSVGTDRGPTTLSWTRETVCDGQCRCQSVRGCSWGAQQSSRRWEEVEMSQSPSSRPGCSRQPGRPQVVLRHSTLDRGFHRELGRPCSHAVARGGSGESEVW